MTYLYMNRKDGEWARIDIDKLDGFDRFQGDLWDFIAREFPELWKVLPIDADLVIGDGGHGFHPGRFETFGKMAELVKWIQEAEE